MAFGSWAPSPGQASLSAHSFTSRTVLGLSMGGVWSTGREQLWTDCKTQEGLKAAGKMVERPTALGAKEGAKCWLRLQLPPDD